MSEREVTLRYLRALVNDLERMSDEEFLNETDRGTGRSRRSKDQQAALTEHKSEEHLARLVLELENAGTRELAREFILRDSVGKTRVGAEMLARRLGVHVNKHDTKDALVDKIVEAAIGVRLRSAAIRGLSLKGGPGEPAE